MYTSTASPRLSGSVTDALIAARDPLLFALRLWASVCLALFVAFWLELDNPYWAGTSAAIVCLPQLGASLRKAWFRMIGTVIGATMIVVLTACFPQDRIGFLGLLALWGGICALGATVLRNFASYAAALAGITAAIIAADNLGATGGASPDVFMLAVTRASEICIGIVCAGIILAGTDLGGGQRRLRLAGLLAYLAAEILGRFTRTLTLAGPQRSDTQAERRELVRRVIALEPAVDQAFGESSHLRHNSATLEAAVFGLFRALSGWRVIATHIGRLPEDSGQETGDIVSRMPPELRSAQERGSPARWTADPLALRRSCEEAVRRLLAFPARTPSLRVLADETARVLDGLVHLLDGLALLVDAPGWRAPRNRRFRLSVPDWLPAHINAVRAIFAIAAAEFFWVATAWPNGALAIVFAAAVVLLLSPRGDMAFGGAIAFTLGTAGAAVFAALLDFAVLPSLATFPAFCGAFGLFLVPVGFALARSRQPAATAALTAMAFNFVPLASPTNQMNYDTAQFYNSALAIVVGCGVAPLAFWLLPPLSPAVRARRLLALTLRDLRRLARVAVPPRLEDWEGRIYGRLAAMPDQAEPLQRARLVAALSVGNEIIHLRRAAPRLGAELDAALADFARGDCASASAQLGQIERHLAADSDHAPETTVVLRTRGRLLVIAETLAAHASYFDAGAFA